MNKPAFVALGMALLGLTLSGCGKNQSAGAPPMVPVQVVAIEARQRPISETLSIVGTLAANELVEIKSETEGSVAEINFEEGQAVEQARLLIKLDDRKLTAAAAEAEANFKLSQANYERSKELFKDQLISQQEFEQLAAQFQATQAGLELKKQQLRDTRILAPFAGITGSRQVSPGQVISVNTVLTWLVDIDPVKAEMNVPERFLSQLRTGQKIDVAVATFPGRTFAGEVFFIAPFVDPATRTALVKAAIANANHELKPGMFANLDLTLNVKENALVIPEAALMLSGERANVFVVTSTNTAQLRPVQPGIRLAGNVEIVRGLQEGELVVVEGTQKVRPGGPVKLGPPEHATPYLTEGKTQKAKANHEERSGAE